MAIRLVLADDHPILLDGLQRLFQLEPDFEVVARCADGAEAVRAVARHRPDVLVLDLGMPVMDGFEFVAELRRAPDTRRIHVVVMTSRDVGEEERRRLNGGVERVLQKSSLTRAELLQALREILQRVRHPGDHV
jgi:DNA-binding NarL/FixJ family response regulator